MCVCVCVKGDHVHVGEVWWRKSGLTGLTPIWLSVVFVCCSFIPTVCKRFVTSRNLNFSLVCRRDNADGNVSWIPIAAINVHVWYFKRGNPLLFQFLKCDNLLLLSVFYHLNWMYLYLPLLVGQNKQFKDVTLGSGRMFLRPFMEKIICRLIINENNCNSQLPDLSTTAVRVVF